MMFGDNGVFLSEIKFDKSDSDLSTAEVDRLLKYNIGKAFKNLKSYLKNREAITSRDITEKITEKR